MPRTHSRNADFDPADYRVEAVLDTGGADGDGGWMAYSDEVYAGTASVGYDRVTDAFEREVEALGSDLGCAHCGRRSGMRYYAFVRHLPTGDLVVFGSSCVADAGLPDVAAYVRKRTEGAARAAAWREHVREERARWEAEEPEQSTALDIYAEEIEAGGDRDRFLDDLVAARDKYGALTPGQSPWPTTAMVHRIEYAEREAAEAERLEHVPPLAEGRRSLAGEIVSIKSEETDYGYSTRMLVVLEDGNKVYGTLPSSISLAEVGDRVAFDAAVSVSDRDEHFGYFKRPTRARVEEEVSA